MLWHGWLRALGVGDDRAPWANSLGQLADISSESVLGAHPVDGSGFWSPHEFWGPEDLAIGIGDHPCV